MPSGQIDDISQKANRKKDELVARPDDGQQGVKGQEVRGMESSEGKGVLGQHLDHVLKHVVGVHVAIVVEVELCDETRNLEEPDDGL